MGETFREMESLLEKGDFTEAQKRCDGLSVVFQKTLKELRANLVQELDA
jgi:hypothetical protein